MPPPSDNREKHDASEPAGVDAAHQTLLDRLAELKTSKSELAEANARNEATLKATVDGIITIDAGGTIEVVNAAALALFGYAADELIGENIKLLMPPPYRDAHDAYLETYRKTGVKRIIGSGREVVGLRKNGSTFPMELSVGEAIADERQVFAGVIRDLTDKKRSEQEHQYGLAQMSAFLKTAVDGIISINARGIIETFNPAAERIFGYRAVEVVGKNVRMLMPHHYAEEHDDYLRRCLSSGEKRIIGIGREVTGLRKDGTLFPMDLAVSEAYGQTEKAFTGIVRDLSDRKQAEEAQASLASILEDSLNEIFVFDAQTLRFLQVNRGARENLGYSMEELQRLTPIDIKPELSSAEFDDIIEPLRAGTQARLHFETLHERKDGTRYPVDIHLQLASYGGVSAFVAMVFDMAENRKAEEALARSEKRAQEAEKLASIATLTAGIAHDVGTPMSVILGYAQMIEKSAENEKQRERARIIAEQTRRVTDLVQTLLNMSRPGEPKRVLLDLGQRIEHALNFFREKLRTHGVVVERDFTDVPQLQGDPDRLEQVFLNLIVNAVDAMPNGGTLTIHLETVEDGHVRVRIADTGTGIAAEHLARIFEPFYTTKDRGKGNGLGLLVSRSIVNEHGGEIEVTSEVGVGTEFCIDLPCSPPALPQPPPA